MKLTTQQVLEARAGLTSILRGSVDAVMAYRLGRMHRKLTEEAKDFSTVQKDLFEKLAVDDKVPPENRAEFERQNTALLAEEIDIDIKPISFDDLQKAVVDNNHVIPGEAWLQIEPILVGLPE